jgi:hypothetical protein
LSFPERVNNNLPFPILIGRIPFVRHILDIDSNTVSPSLALKLSSSSAAAEAALFFTSTSIRKVETRSFIIFKADSFFHSFLSFT